MNVSRGFYITFVVLYHFHITHSVMRVVVRSTLHDIKHERDVLSTQAVPARELVLEVIPWSSHSALSPPHPNKNAWLGWIQMQWQVLLNKKYPSFWAAKI